MASFLDNTQREDYDDYDEEVSVNRRNRGAAENSRTRADTQTETRLVHNVDALGKRMSNMAKMMATTQTLIDSLTVDQSVPDNTGPVVSTPNNNFPLVSNSPPNRSPS